MKIESLYVAGKWQRRKEIRKIMDTLESMGYKITANWPTREQPHITNKHRALCAAYDLRGVQKCDALIAIVDGDLEYNSGGTQAEVGAALVLGKRVYLVGHGIDKCIFTYHRNIRRFKNIEEMLKTMGVIKCGTH